MSTEVFLSEPLSGKRIAVIGCAQGHGNSIARGCSENGAEVLLLDRNPAIVELRDRIRQAGGKAQSGILDVRKAETVKTTLQDLCRDSEIDGIIYFPRGRVRKDISEITPEDWDLDLDLALKGAFFAVQAAVPYFVNPERMPFVITLSSILSEFVGNESAGYHSAKGGLESLTRYLAVHLGPKGIRVNSIQMGWIIKDVELAKFMEPENQSYRTLAEQAHPLKKIGTAQDLLNTVVFLASEKSAFITGQVIRLDGGLTIQEQSHLLRKMEQG